MMMPLISNSKKVPESLLATKTHSRYDHTTFSHDLQIILVRPVCIDAHFRASVYQIELWKLTEHE